MNKTQIVITHIAANYQDRTLAGMVISRIAGECEVSPSTVYNAIRQLRTMGAVQGKAYTGRQFVHPDEIAAAAADDGTLLLTENKVIELARKFCATSRAIHEGVRYGVRSGRMKELNGGFYGYMVRIAA